MPSSRSEREQVACSDIVANAERVHRFLIGFSLETIEADERTNYAVLRCLEII